MAEEGDVGGKGSGPREQILYGRYQAVGVGSQLISQSRELPYAPSDAADSQSHKASDR